MKGQSGLITKIIPAIVVPMLLIVGLITFSNFESSVDTADLTAEANSAINQTADNTYSGFDLGSILPLVIFAAVIISVIVGAFVTLR